MKLSQPPRLANLAARRIGEHARTRTVLLMLVVFLCGAAASALWFHSQASRRAAGQPEPGALAPGTEAVLQHLGGPVEIRYYAMMDPAAVPEATKAYAERVQQLLDKYQRESGGKLKVVRYDSLSRSNASAALADGIKSFADERGDAGYLGISVVRNGQKETIPSLSPEWEQALELDLTRALARAAGTDTQPPPPTPPPVQTDAETLAALRTTLPNVDSVSLQEGTRLLQQTALTQLTQVAQDTDARIKAAEQTYIQAKNNNSEADQQAARALVQQLQAQQNEQLKQVVARSQAQIAALQRLKTGQ